MIVDKYQERKVIKCPHCGWSFLPGEILVPDNVVGQPGDIVRDPMGNIIYEEYLPNREPLAEEHYICDNCDKPFVIEIETHYKAKPELEENDFSDLSVKLF